MLINSLLLVLLWTSLSCVYTDITYNNLFLHILRSGACPKNLANSFCLNNGTCFMLIIAQKPIYSCECAPGSTGERCEDKQPTSDA